MAFISNLLSVSQPSGGWVSIIKAFEGATGNYVLAIILLTVVIRLVWAVVDTFTKYNQQKMTKINAQMQPELEKLKVKYEKQPQVLQAKQNELQQRYYGKSQMGSCLIMLVTMALNMVIFFTLFSGLNTMASYKIAANYDNIKYTYANCLNVTDEYLGDEITQDEKDNFNDYQNLKFVIEGKGENKTISLVKIEGENETVLKTIPYKYDFSSEELAPADPEGEPEGQAEGESSEPETIKISSNANIYKLIAKYFPVDDEGKYDVTQDIVLKVENEGQENEEKLYLSQALQNVAMKNVIDVYDANKESFLWIDNIWIADSAFSKSILNYSSLANQMGKKNVGEKELEIYNAFMPDLAVQRSQTNGYFIVPILCILVSVLSMFITSQYNKYKNKKKGLPTVKANAKWTQFILPVVLGIFALFYNSVFAIYMLTGQVVSTLILPLQLFIVDKFLDKKEKKEEDKKVTVDYTRKF